MPQRLIVPCWQGCIFEGGRDERGRQCQTENCPRLARTGPRGAKADDYARYLYEQGIRPLEEKALAVQLLREDRAEESEFITISYWESVEAMSRFAGPDPQRIHHLPRDAEFLIELPESVQVLQIAASKGLFGTI